MTRRDRSRPLLRVRSCHASGDASPVNECANAACTPDAHTLRPGLGELTPGELDRLAPHAEDRLSRARFYDDACAALARAAAERPPARRVAERDAIHSTLEQHRRLS